MTHGRNSSLSVGVSTLIGDYIGGYRWSFGLRDDRLYVIVLNTNLGGENARQGAALRKDLESAGPPATHALPHPAAPCPKPCVSPTSPHDLQE